MIANLHRRALWLAYATVGYNILEGAASVLAGAWSGSIALIGFGLDSFVESLSGGVIIWRFARHGRMSPAAEARKEEQAVRLVGYTFFVLAAYVLYEAGKKLVFREVPEPSLVGLIIAGVSLVAMPALFWLKYRTARQLGSRSLLADAKQTLACFFLSAALLVGLGLNYLGGYWQADPMVGLAIGALLLKEGCGTLKEGKLCSCCAPAGTNPQTPQPAGLTSCNCAAPPPKGENSGGG